MQILKAYVIIIVDIVFVLSVALTLFQRTNYTLDQLSYNNTSETIGYTDSGPQRFFRMGLMLILAKLVFFKKFF